MSACPTTFFFFILTLQPPGVGTERFHDLYAVRHQILVTPVLPGLRAFPRFFFLTFRKKSPPIKVYHTGLQVYPTKNDQSLCRSCNLHSKKSPAIMRDSTSLLKNSISQNDPIRKSPLELFFTLLLPSLKKLYLSFPVFINLRVWINRTKWLNYTFICSCIIWYNI